MHARLAGIASDCRASQMSDQPICRLRIKVSACASEDRVQGFVDDVLKIKVRATPEKGKANKAVKKLLAETLGIPVRSIRITRGQANPLKVVEIAMQETAVFAGLPHD